MTDYVWEPADVSWIVVTCDEVSATDLREELSAFPDGAECITWSVKGEANRYDAVHWPADRRIGVNMGGNSVWSDTMSADDSGVDEALARIAGGGDGWD